MCLRHVLLSLTLIATPIWAATEVKVGASVFPPYIVEKPNGAMQIELVDLINQFQQKYHFKLITTNASRRLSDFDHGLYDVSFFDNPEWGWQGKPIDASRVYLLGGENYIALAKPGRIQSYFKDLSHKRILGMRGYHYGFANFNADPKYLADTFNFYGTTNNAATIKLLLAGQGDIALVTQAYLNQYLAEHPTARDKIIVSTHLDQEYRHSVIVRKGIKPSVAEIEAILSDMQKAGILQKLWQKYGASTVSISK
jgi:polar amino acid transport system substrate-binding protein